MSLLQTLHPEARLTWEALARVPTPVRELPGFSLPPNLRVWLKDEGGAGGPYGGNKVRKLEWLLPEAKRRGTVITMGAIGSHHVLATCVYGVLHGIQVHPVVVPQVDTPHVRENLRAVLKLAARLHAVPTGLAMVARVFQLWRELGGSGRPLVIPIGGSSPAGVVGWVQAAFELADQVKRGELPAPSDVFVALGSGGTAVGLWLGLRAAGLDARVHAVRVVDLPFGTRPQLNGLVRRTRAHLARLGVRLPAPQASQLVVHQAWNGHGYGDETPESLEARRLASERAGLELEGTYTGKTLACLLHSLREQQLQGTEVLFVNTLSSRPMEPLLDGAPPTVPDEYLPMLRPPHPPIF